MIKINVSRKALRKFTAESKRMFPRECFSALLGTSSGDKHYVEDIWIPEDLDKYVTTEEVSLPDHWAVEANEHASDQEMEVLGCHHSHPYLLSECNKAWTPRRMLKVAVVPSLGDWELGWSNIAAITAIIQFEQDRFKHLTRFFGPGTLVKING